jgi:transcriptional regulator with XRE-family HTH domain
MFPNNLKRLRTAKGITQEELADIVGKTQQAIYLWEKGENEPSIESFNKLADYFGVTVDFLLGRQTEVVAEEGIFYAQTPEAIERIKRFAQFERSTQHLSDENKKGSSGFQNMDADGTKMRYKRAGPSKKDKKQKTGS